MYYQPHQIKYGKRVKKMLVKKGFVYLVSPPRAGKTATAIYCCEHIDKIKKVLVITKPSATKGWELFTKSDMCHKHYTITTRLKVLKIDVEAFNVVIFDESHTITSNIGKPTQHYLNLRKHLYSLPQILISATPTVETKLSLYYQLTKSKFNPFRKYKNFYKFFDEYGTPDIQPRGYGLMGETYKKHNKKLTKKFKKFSVVMPKPKGFRDTADKKVYITLSKKQQKMYNTLVKENYVKKKGLHFEGDTIMGLRVMLHQIEGGVVKSLTGDTYTFKDNPKLNYLRTLKGKVGVMSHFQSERVLLKANLPSNFEIYSANAHSEGVDLSHLDVFVIYSQDYSGAKHIQRRDRVVNMNKKDNNLEVTFLLVRGAISEQVYDTCSQKKNFNDSVFKRSVI